MHRHHQIALLVLSISTCTYSLHVHAQDSLSQKYHYYNQIRMQNQPHSRTTPSRHYSSVNSHSFHNPSLLIQHKNKGVRVIQSHNYPNQINLQNKQLNKKHTNKRSAPYRYSSRVYSHSHNNQDLLKKRTYKNVFVIQPHNYHYQAYSGNDQLNKIHTGINYNRIHRKQLPRYNGYNSTNRRSVVVIINNRNSNNHKRNSNNHYSAFGVPIGYR